MTESPYGLYASHRSAGELPRSGEHPQVVSGQIVSAGAYDPAGRSYDPLFPGQAYAPGGRGAPTNIYIAQAPKSVGVAFVLTFFFGCFGMFYSTITGALIMLGVAVGVTVLGALFSAITLGLGALIVIPLTLLIWPTTIIWGCLAASNHNQRLRVTASHAAQMHTTPYGPPHGAPPA